MRIPILLIMFIFLMILSLSCNRSLTSKFSNISFENVQLIKNKSQDSLELSFYINFPPKTLNKKAVLVIQPIILIKDTLKFVASSYMGEKLEDGTSISYRKGATGDYHDKIKLPRSSYDSGIFQILLIGYKKGKVTKYLGYEEEVNLK